MRVCTTKGGWDDCTPMNWPFNFKPASLEVTPQIVSVIKSPFPNPSVLAKTFFLGGGVKLSFQEFCQSNVHVRLPMGPCVFTLGRTFSLLNCHPVLFVLRSIWPKKKKKKRGTHPLLPDSPPVLQLLVTDWIQWPRYDGGKNPGETWILPLMKLPRYVYLFL